MPGQWRPPDMHTQTNAVVHRTTRIHVHTQYTYTHKWTLWLKQTLCHCRLFICQKGHPESPVLESESVCVCVCALFILSHTSGLLCFTGHYIVWHMGFAHLLYPGNEAKQAASEWRPWVCRRFHIQSSCLLAREKLGYRSASIPSAGSICCVLVRTSPYNFWLSGRGLGEQVVTVARVKVTDRPSLNSSLSHPHTSAAL